MEVWCFIQTYIAGVEVAVEGEFVHIEGTSLFTKEIYWIFCTVQTSAKWACYFSVNKVNCIE